MKWPALFFYCERASFSKLERIVEALLTRFLNSFRREPQLAVVVVLGVIIAYLSLSPTLMLFYGSFRSKPLGVPNAEFTLAHYLYAYTDPLDVPIVVQFVCIRLGLLISCHWVRGDSGLDFDSHQCAVEKVFRTNRDHSEYFSAGDARRFMDGAAKPAHRD